MGVLCFPGCAPRVLSASALNSVSRPAFVSWTRVEAGPYAEVFRDTRAWGDTTGGLSPAEADAKLSKKLFEGMSRFEAAETLRGKVYATLPRQEPWMSAVPPVEVSRALQSLLVTDRDNPQPDYRALGRIGADVVVEFVVERFGLKSRDGRVSSYLEGYGRMFRIDGERELWRRSYVVENTSGDDAPLAPAQLLKEPHLFRLEMNRLLDAVVDQFATDLNPSARE